MRLRKPAVWALLLGLTQALLYSCFLPLWEGFDEPFHYAYVEALSAWHEIPILNQTPVSSEIRASLSLAPLSRLLSGAMPNSISFEEWARLPLEEKLRRRRELDSLPHSLRTERSGTFNYEAQQAPLAYLIEAPLDALFSRYPLPFRILLLRVFGAIASAVLLWIGCCKLLPIVGLTGAYQLAVLACIFSGQMLWASVAHVGNDWLAVALTLWFLLAMAELAAAVTLSRLFFSAAVLSAGLLTKAYFLVFIPLFLAAIFRRPSKPAALALALPLLTAGPWYLRNFLVSGSLSGTQQGVAGIGLLDALAAIPHINWLKSITDFTRWSLWTGNWSFLSFSRITLNIEALLLAASLVLYWMKGRPIGSPQKFLLAGCGSLVLGLLYQTCVTWVHTGGASIHAEPWYWQGVIPCLWILGFRGLQTSGIAGKIGASLLCFITAWVAVLTYVAKLIPFYAGGISRATLPAVFHWWTGNRAPDMHAVLLGPLPLIYTLLFVLMALLCATLTANIYRLWLKN